MVRIRLMVRLSVSVRFTVLAKICLTKRHHRKEIHGRYNITVNTICGNNLNPFTLTSTTPKTYFNVIDVKRSFTINERKKLSKCLDKSHALLSSADGAMNRVILAMLQCAYVNIIVVKWGVTPMLVSFAISISQKLLLTTDMVFTERHSRIFLYTRF